MHKKVKILTIVVSLLGIILWLLLLGNQDPYTDIMFILSYFLLGGTALVAVGYSIYNLVQHPQSLRKAGIALGSFAGIFLISLVIGMLTNDSGENLMVDIGLYMFYFLTLIASLLMIFAGFGRFTKK